MEQKEIEVFNKLGDEILSNLVTRKTSKQARDIYNIYNTDKINYCMCQSGKRTTLSKQMYEWFKAFNR